MQTVLSKIENLKIKSKNKNQAPPPQSSAKPKYKNVTKQRKQKHVTDSITPFSHKSEWDESQFVRSSQPKLKKAQKHLWLIRHGERYHIRNNSNSPPFTYIMWQTDPYPFCCSLHVVCLKTEWMKSAQMNIHYGKNR